MYKQTVNNINIQLVMQQAQVFNQSMSHAGVLSMNPDGFRFEEAVKQKRPRRNPKLYEGQYVSLVHRSDGKYACSLKCISPHDKDFDHNTVAFRIYLELIDALQIIR
ncbi:MAG: hypothetical protein J6R54_06960 [Bacteroidaceae bacterium]|jgi:hypothetical protein|nr:hypothetical protein [Bacteroidaceae bacterium]